MTDPDTLASLDWNGLRTALRELLSDSKDPAGGVAEAPTGAALNAPGEALSRGNWRSVVELLTLRISETAPEFDDAGLHEALGLYELVLDRSERAGAYSHTEAVTRRLNLSSALLRETTPREDVDQLNPTAIADLVLRELPLSLDEAASKARRWRELDRTEILRLRTAKNLLTPAIAALHHAAPDSPIDARLEPWETLLPLLP